jgi:protein-disulfide isomerase
VALSPYAVFARLPVAVWGILGYVVMGLLALSGSRKRQRNLTWPWGLLLLLASFSALTSTILAYVSATQIASLCLFCVGSYAVNAGLVVLAVLAWRHSRVRLLHLVRSDAEALRGRPVLTVNLAIVGVTVLLGLELLVPRYWVAPGWTGLPQRPSGLDANGQHWIGASEPVLTIVEFSDYQCPYCRRAHKDVRLLVAKHAKRLRLIHRHLPLDNACHPALSSPFHEHACRLAEAAECAGLQGRFWEMNDALFSTQDRVKAQDVDPMELAVRLGLNRSRFEQCMKGHAAMPRIASDLQAAMARRLDGTPSFLIGEAVYQGRIPETALAALRETTP